MGATDSLGGVVMLKILIAEDDRELQQLFSHVLNRHGYTVAGVSRKRWMLWIKIFMI